MQVLTVYSFVTKVKANKHELSLLFQNLTTPFTWTIPSRQTHSIIKASPSQIRSQRILLR